jgi:hypothetical protein
MNYQLVTSTVISVIYFISKFIEMRFIIKENKPLKELIRDSIIVFISATLTLIILDQFDFNNIIGNIKSSPIAFVNNPDF